MNTDALRDLLESVACGQTLPAKALERLKDLPFEEAAGALVDVHRELRQGFPEVVFGAGKTADQITTILRRLHESHGAALATRIEADAARQVIDAIPEATHDPVARLLRWDRLPNRSSERTIALVSAGSCDEPVASEIAGTLEFLGHTVNQIRDVGVAGLHRLLAKLNDLRSASVLIVVAGMDGALPSVVGGFGAAIAAHRIVASMDCPHP